MKNQGIPHDLFDGRPVIGICNTWSELTPCNAHFRELAEHVKRGVWEAGGLPVEFPVMSLGETQPAADRDAVPQPRSMDVEESIRANPIDGVVLLMRLRQDHAGAAHGRGERATCRRSCVSGGPMLNGKFRGQDIGSGTDVWRFSEEVQGRRDDARGASWRPRRACRARPATA